MKSLSIGLAVAGFATLVAFAQAASSSRNPTEKAVSEIDYVRDSRVGLCFAVHGNTFAHIPCVTPNGPVPANSGARPLSVTYVSEMQYARDPRSGLCFGDHYGSIAEVPCAAVQHLLIP